MALAVLRMDRFYGVMSTPSDRSFSRILRDGKPAAKRLATAFAAWAGGGRLQSLAGVLKPSDWTANRISWAVVLRLSFCRMLALCTATVLPLM